MSTDVISSGATTVSTAMDTTYVVLGPATLLVDSGGSVTGATAIGAGSVIYVDSGGTTANDAIIGGTELVTGTVIDTVVSDGGSESVFNGGVAIGSTITASGYQEVCNASVIGTILAGNQQILVDATATGTVITSGGDEYIGAGGTSNGTIITSGGFQFVDFDGTANGTQVGAGGTEALFGSGSGTTTAANGLTIVGGTLDNSIVAAGGVETVQFGGIANGLDIQGGGFAWVTNGTLNSSTVDGSLQVLANGVSNNSVVGNGGYEYVGAQGSSSGDVVNAGGFEYVDAGGTVTNATVNGGFLAVVGGANATGTTVNSGEEDVMGTSSNTTLAGGQEVVSAGGIQNNITFGGTPASLNLDSATGLTGTVSGFSVGDAIDFLNQTFSSANFDGSTLTLTSGNSTYSYNFSNLETGTELILATDGNGGAAVTMALLAQASGGQSPVQSTFSWIIPQETTQNTMTIASSH